jgi:hypothetical protein
VIKTTNGGAIGLMNPFFYEDCGKIKGSGLVLEADGFFETAVCYFQDPAAIVCTRSPESPRFSPTDSFYFV